MTRAIYQDGKNLIAVSDTFPMLITVSWTCDARLKMIVRHEADAPYYYDVPNDGTKTTFPLCDGNGRYLLDLVKNVGGTWATVTLVSHQLNASEMDMNVGYLAPSGWCNWSQSGLCKAMACDVIDDLKIDYGKGQPSATEIASEVIRRIGKRVSYDREKADALRGNHGYVPDPDKVLERGKGVCSDIASTTCAVLRCIGIPARLVTGYMMPEQVSHAWVQVLSDGKWLTYDPTSLITSTKAAGGKEHKYRTVSIW